MSTPTLTLADQVVAAKGTAFSDLAGEAVVLHLRTGRYFGLNSTSAVIWKLIQSPCSIADVRDAVSRTYDVPLARCEAEVIAFLEDLQRSDLVSITPSGGVPAK